MSNARENLLNLWRTRKGLIMLLLAGGLICLLAALAPQAWATPDQKRLSNTITEFNHNPQPDTCVSQCDGPIYISAKDPQNPPFGSLTRYGVPVYVTDNITWTKDFTSITDPEVRVRNPPTTVDIVDGDFDPPLALVWAKPLPGNFDVFIDVNGNGVLNDGDGILGPFGSGPGQPDWVGAYICVDACVGGATVPATTRFQPLWFGLAALVAVGAGAVVVWKRRRG
jgi:hypothetical protein